MKVLHISTEDNRPGAARAAYRLSQGLNRGNVTSEMLVQSKRSDDLSVHIVQQGGLGRIASESRKLLDKVPLIQYPKRLKSPFSTQWVPNIYLLRRVEALQPDLINLHWICDGFLKVESIRKLKKPLIWTLRDMWPFTGGCHYDQECNRYLENCGQCPQLSSQKNSDLSHAVWKRKLKSWQDLDLTIVALSSWIAKCAASSSIFRNRRIEVIPNGIDTELYRPIDRKTARQVLRLPNDAHLLLFGAVQATSNRRKGFHLLLSALHDLKQVSLNKKLELVVFGASEPKDPQDFGFKVHYLGKLNDDLTLALAYSAADVLIAPSMQENLANTVLEAIACGTPSIAFKIGGMPDLIDHQENGYLANPFDSRDLSQGIQWVLENDGRHHALSENARKKVDSRFTLNTQVERYKSLYREVLGNR